MKKKIYAYKDLIYSSIYRPANSNATLFIDNLFELICIISSNNDGKIIY